ncbi:MAG TPA: Smr/MutS family protein [Candidatus Udaeobacter sp.]|nr:Smr/MutS family protein [Candidatus Udaeobacter sp.]
MEKSESQIFAAELGVKMPELDLHGKFPHEIEDEVRLFILENYHSDKEMVRVIYGGGAGKMREVVLALFETKELKDIIADIDVKEGNCVVVFKD